MSDLPDYYAGGADVISRSEWAAKEGTHVDYIGANDLQPFDGEVLFPFNVPAGVKLYITQFGFASFPSAIADADKLQICVAMIKDATLGTYLWYQGGNGGGSQTFPTPIVIPGAHAGTLHCVTRAAHNSDVRVYAGGYLK